MGRASWRMGTIAASPSSFDPRRRQKFDTSRRFAILRTGAMIFASVPRDSMDVPSASPPTRMTLLHTVRGRNIYIYSFSRVSCRGAQLALFYLSPFPATRRRRRRRRRRRAGRRRRKTRRSGPSFFPHQFVPHPPEGDGRIGPFVQIELHPSLIAVRVRGGLSVDVYADAGDEHRSQHAHHAVFEGVPGGAGAGAHFVFLWFRGAAIWGVSFRSVRIFWGKPILFPPLLRRSVLRVDGG
mmetsp:Transcript_23302/g.68824  ORF Transcript_23302/g.68824 Transcript_23302/m.68824 type:complete len:239 (+) Transcript_23302:331-1047(+)